MNKVYILQYYHTSYGENINFGETFTNIEAVSLNKATIEAKKQELEKDLEERRKRYNELKLILDANLREAIHTFTEEDWEIRDEFCGDNTTFYQIDEYECI